ncbi:MAG: PD-(D/E)XK nuclease family protein, partial [Candidatus Adiutrix sp.]|nr:PD-(D/E)XK nuclease family protein [Candidatus Adiutrix sp.]
TAEPGPRLAAERLELQAALLARYLDDLFEGRRGVLVRDGAGPGRPPGPGDVAVLFRSRKGMTAFKEALGSAGWPCRLAVGNNPFHYAEVKGLLAAFQYLCGFDEEISLAALLRSPLGPVSDQGQMRLVWPKNAPGSVPLSRYFAKAPLEFPPELDENDRRVLMELRELLAELRLLAGRVPPVEILERLVEQRRLMPLAVAETDGHDRARAITAFLALSRGLGRRREHQPQGPAEELMALRQNWDQRRGGDAEAEAEGEAITLMTAHGAKGLEFPVVILAQADAKARVNTGQAVISSQGVLAVNYKSWPEDTARPLDFQALRDEDAALDEHENRRLLYVAATRARDHLVFLGWPKERKAKDAPQPDTVWLEALLNRPEAASLTGAAEYESEEVQLWLDSKSGRAESPRGDAAPPPEAAGSAPALLAPMRLTGSALAVTALSQLLAAPERFWEQQLGLDMYSGDADWRPGQPFFSLRPAHDHGPALAPTEAGRLFHAVLEYLDPLNPAVPQLFAAQAARLGLSPAAAEAAALTAKIEAFVRGPLGQAWGQALASGGFDRREQPFQIVCQAGDGMETVDSNGETLTITGVIDLFFQSPDGAGQIVDYKLAVRHEGAELAAYENQVRLYGQALRSAGFAGPLRAALYFAGGEAPVVHEVPLDQARPIQPLTAALTSALNVLRRSRPLVPSRPGALL